MSKLSSIKLLLLSFVLLLLLFTISFNININILFKDALLACCTCWQLVTANRKSHLAVHYIYIVYLIRSNIKFQPPRQPILLLPLVLVVSIASKSPTGWSALFILSSMTNLTRFLGLYIYVKC